MTRHTFYVALLLASFAPSAHAVFINEFHYDNSGTDVGEGVEIAGQAGTDLSGYTIALYNGTNGSVYRSVAIKGVLDDQQNGFGAAFFNVGSLQNGGPDGIALVDPDGQLVQFLSYEGAFAGSEGAALGVQSQDVGVIEDGSDPAGLSLQLSGIGLSPGDFDWVLGNASYGFVNEMQTFDMAPVPLPATLPMMAGATALFGWLRRRSPGKVAPAT